MMHGPGAGALARRALLRAPPRLWPVQGYAQLGLKFREFDGEHGAARMKDEIEALRAADRRGGAEPRACGA